MSGGGLPPSNTFSVGQQQPFLNHDAGNHFQSSPSHGTFVQAEKKGIGQETQYSAGVKNPAQSVSQVMNPASRGEEISNVRLSYGNVTVDRSNDSIFSAKMSISALIFVICFLYVFFAHGERNKV